MTRQKQPGWIRRLWGYMLRHRRDVFISIGAAILGSVAQVFTPLVARQIVDKVITEHTSPLLPWLGLLIALALAIFGFTYLRRYRGGRVGLHVQNDLRNDMQAHLQRMDFATLDTMSTGQVVSRANSDSALVQGLLNMLPLMSGNVLLMLFSLAVMFVLSPPLALVSLIVAPLLVVTSYRMRRRVLPATWDAQQREGEVAQMVDEDVAGVRVVKAFGREKLEVERMSGVASRLYGSQLRVVRLQSRYQPLLQSIPTLAQVAVLAFGGYLAIQGQLSIGTFLAFSTYIAQLMSPTRQLAIILAVGQQAKVGVERIFELLDRDPAIRDAPGAIDVVAGDIRFDSVSFGYGDAPVLDDIDLTIAAGERVAIVGPSGSGKSTLAALVSRFYDPDAGTVSVGGVDVRAAKLRSLRAQLGVVFEESFLFSDTVRANIAYGRPGADQTAIDAAARVASADRFIAELPNGYDTVVGERGLSLSGGQRQRIALARAILSDPAVLILDDATSAIDARTEEAIHDALRDELGTRTVILIAHRESTLRLADRILVTDHGRIVDSGTHEELLDRSALYRSLLAEPDEEDAIQTIEDLPSGTTASAWVKPAEKAPRPVGVGGGGGGGLGIGLGGSAGGRGVSAMFVATPELLERVAALGPVKDVPVIDLETETAHVREFSLGTLLKQFRLPLLGGLALVVLDALAGLAGPVFVKTGVDGGVQTGSLVVLFAASAGYLVVTLADLVDQIAQTFVTGRIAQRVMMSLRVRIFAQLQRLSLDYYEREMAGRIMTRMTTDVDQFESLVQNGLLSALVSIVTFVGVGVALVIVDLPLGLATLTVVIPLAIATVLFRRRSSSLYDAARERISIVNADFQESLSGVRESQAFTHEDVTIARFRGLGARYLESRVAAQRLVAIYFPFVQFLSGVADVIVLGLGAVLIARGDLSSGALIAFILYIDMFFSPIQQLSQVFDSWQQTRVSVNRIASLMALDTLTPEAAHPLAPGRLEGRVDLEGVRFAYPSAPAARDEPRGPQDPRLRVAQAATSAPPEALTDIDLHIAAGETVALVGETGAGKSTVMKLVARFYDADSGTVRVDGHDVTSLDLEAFRRQLGYVPQEAFLFTGSVRDNIAYGRPDATDAEVEAAARAVGAHDVIGELSGGVPAPVERARSVALRGTSPAHRARPRGARRPGDPSAR